MTDEELVRRVFNSAMGMAGALATGAEVVRELVRLAQQDREVLEAARSRAQSEVEQAEQQQSRAVDDAGPPEAPALLATRLLSEAINALADSTPERS